MNAEIELLSTEVGSSLNKQIDLLNAEQWSKLNCILSTLITTSPQLIECVKGSGDTDEAVISDVIRFLDTRHTISAETAPYTDLIYELFSEAHVIEKLSSLLKERNLKLYRMQANIMHKGAFIGPHTDTESDANYRYTVIFRLNSSYSGGELIVYSGNSSSNMMINQPNDTSFLLDSTLLHEVRPVTRGCRNSLIALFG